MALNIGNKVYRNLQEQVGYNSEQINKIFSILDGIDYEDHVVVIEDITNPLNEEEMAVVNQAVSFLVYQDKLYFKDSSDPEKIYFSAVINIIGTELITIRSYQIAVKIENGELQLIDGISELYSSGKIDEKISDLESLISNLASASPKGVYATLADLQTAYPTGTTGIYVIQADGHWYYWSGSAWTDGGTYQATEIADKSITPKKLDRLYADGIIGKNKFDKTTIKRGGFYNLYGVWQTNVDYFASDFIDIHDQTNVFFSQHSAFAQQVFVCYYDSSKNFLNSQLITGVKESALTIPIGAYYLIFSVKLETLDTFQIEFDTQATPYEEYKQLYKYMPTQSETVYVGAGEAFTKFIDALSYAITKPNTKVYVKEGTYDLIQEYGSSFFENYDSSSPVGPILSNGVEIYFENGAELVFDYDGANAEVVSRFSPLNADQNGLNTDFKLENVKVVAKNCRYVLHDEMANNYIPYKHEIKNCHFEITYTLSTPAFLYSHNSIGGGLGHNGYIIVDGSYFLTDICWHNNADMSDASAISHLVITDNFIEHGTIKLRHCGASTEITTALATNNRTMAELVNEFESALYTIPNTKFISFDNPIIDTSVIYDLTMVAGWNSLRGANSHACNKVVVNGHQMIITIKDRLDSNANFPSDTEIATVELPKEIVSRITPVYSTSDIARFNILSQLGTNYMIRVNKVDDTHLQLKMASNMQSVTPYALYGSLFLALS